MDIVKIEWLKRVLENGVFTEYKPNDAVHLSKKSTLRYKQLYDKYKDSYAELTAEQTLPEIFIEVECSVSNLCSYLYLYSIFSFSLIRIN